MHEGVGGCEEPGFIWTVDFPNCYVAVQAAIFHLCRLDHFNTTLQNVQTT